MDYMITEDVVDEEFDFPFRRVIRPPLSSSTNPSTNIDDDDDDDQDMHIGSEMDNKKINDDYDEKPASTRISKGKEVAFETRQNWQTPEHIIVPLSPFIPSDNYQYQQNKQQQQQTAIFPSTSSIHDTALPTTSVTSNDSYSGKVKATPSSVPTSVISNDSYSGKVKVPPSSVPTSEYYTMIDPDLPQEEKIRQLVLMLLQQKVDNEYSVLNVSGDDDDETIQAEMTRKNNVQWVWQRVMQKLSDPERNPFGSRPGKQSVYVYARPNPENERHLEKIQKSKQLYSALKMESEERERAFYDVCQYSANAEDLLETTYAGDTINLGSCHDYIDSMDSEKQAFIAEHEQWKDNMTKRLRDLSSSSTPNLQEIVIQKGKKISELRQQLLLINERQIRTGQIGDQLLEDIKAKLKQRTLNPPSINKIIKRIKNNTSQPDQLSPSSSSSSSSSGTINTDDESIQRMKKRRLLGLKDEEMETYGRQSFDHFRILTKLK